MDYTLARRNMIESQLRTNKVTEPAVLAALANVPREIFVPTAMRPRAYTDESLPIAQDRWIMAPMPLGRLIQEAMPQASDNALVIGAGFGYASALLGRLCQSVFAVETDPGLVGEMGSVLTELAIDNVVCIEGALSEGYAAEGPYDVILMAGGVQVIPDALTDQLAEGGRLVAIVEDEDGLGRAMLFGKRNGQTSGRVLFDANVKPLPGFQKEAAFVF